MAVNTTEVILSESTDTDVEAFSISFGSFLVAAQILSRYDRVKRVYRGIMSLADARTVKTEQETRITKNVMRWMLVGGDTSATPPSNPQAVPVYTTEICGEAVINHVGGTLWEVWVDEWTLTQTMSLPGAPSTP